MRLLRCGDVDFEILVSELSAGLIHVPAAGLDKALEHGLGQVVTFLAVDRGALAERDVAEPRHISYGSPGIATLAPIMEPGQFPWTTTRLRDDHIVRFSRRDELPEAAAADRLAYERVGTRSHVSAPLRAGGPVLGVLSLDSVHEERVRSDGIVERLRRLSEVSPRRSSAVASRSRWHSGWPSRSCSRRSRRRSATYGPSISTGRSSRGFVKSSSSWTPIGGG